MKIAKAQRNALLFPRSIFFLSPSVEPLGYQAERGIKGKSRQNSQNNWVRIRIVAKAQLGSEHNHSQWTRTQHQKEKAKAQRPIF